jgi:hypothetical protein
MVIGTIHFYLGTTRIAQLIQTRGLSGTEQESLAKVGTKDAEAYQLYLKGRYRFVKFTKEDFQAAAEFFDRAIARDPNYAGGVCRTGRCK